MRARQLEAKDVPFILEWMKDESINRFFRFDAAHSDESTVLAFINNSNADEHNLHLAIVDDNNEYLGTVSLKNIDPDAKNAEYAISMRKSAHGTGAANFATTEILKKAFYDLKLERVYLNVLSENLRANKFYQKFGFIYEGEFIRHINIRGELKSLKWYRILKEEFKNL